MRPNSVSATRFLLLIGFILTLCSCATRSISNSGYPGDYSSRNPFYEGELSEVDVLGLSSDQPIAEADIQKALKDRARIEVPRGSSIIVIQSGAVTPDEPMMDQLRPHFKVFGFSGIPGQDQVQSQPYSQVLRLTAARGGYSHILCYWGTLETAQENQVTKVISWVPIAGSFIPDETQKMRIRLKAALIDVASGRWTMITPEPIDNKALTAGVIRKSSDQKQVELLKQKGYSTLVSELERYFTS